ncbi:mitochondrial transcription termination factor family protein [Tasmannia lanceolata]|uniref:mitochondrial transcription termination factor family protein n=1 Tax=Tasmannia lanceolata TaxID=3420 RepID=UPI004064B199
MLLNSIHLSILSSFRNRNLNLNPNPNPNPHSSLHPPLLLRFRTSYRQNLQYLKSLSIISTTYTKPPSHETLDQILSVVNYLKSQGFSDSHFARLFFLCPEIFSSDLQNLAPVFAFLTQDLLASPEEACGLISRCPEILLSNVEFCLRPTLFFLRELGLQKLNSPTTLNAHLLNSRVNKLLEKIRFLESLGLSDEESARICARMPAIFGYSMEYNLRPKFEYLVKDMEREIEELKAFPQYFAFSLEKRIVPRHLHLKERKVRVPLPRMLLWSDRRFYAKWK